MTKEFEKNFFVKADMRKTFDELTEGEILKTFSVEITKEMGLEMAAAVEDDFPLYVDENYAKETQFKGVICPPNIHVRIAFEGTDHLDLNRTPGAINPGQKYYYYEPIRYGDTITVVRTVYKKEIKRGKKYCTTEYKATNQKGELVYIGHSTLILPK